MTIKELVHRAHMTLKKFNENKKKLDKNLKISCLNIISRRERNLKGNLTKTMKKYKKEMTVKTKFERSKLEREVKTNLSDRHWRR